MNAFQTAWGRGSESEVEPMHSDLIFNPAIPEWHREEREEVIALCKMMETLLAADTGKQRNLKHVQYRALLDTSVGCMPAAMRPEQQYVQTLLICSTSGRFLIIEQGCPPQTAQNEFKNR